MSYAEKLAAYRELADAYFESERYQDFCATSWRAWTRSCWTGWPGPTSTGCWSGRSSRVYPAHEQERFIAHLRGLLGLWVRDESARLAAACLARHGLRGPAYC